MIEIVKFSVEDAIAISGSAEFANAFRLNQQTGPCYTALYREKEGGKGEIVGCGGVRVDGVGEAWALYSDKAKGMKISLLKETRQWLEIIMRNQALYRIWSECPLPQNERFINCKGLRFRKLDAYLRG
jgi:hypothetical protein